MIWNKQSLILCNKQSLLLRNNEVWSHLLATFIYFFIVSVLRLVTGGGALGGFGLLGILELWLGAAIGVFLLDIDHLFYWWYLHPEKEDSKEAKNIWNKSGLKLKKKLKRLYELGQKWHNTHNRLMFHSAVAQVVLLLLSFYILTSGGSIFGSALIMSINLHLLKDVWTDFVERKEYLKDYLFWQVSQTRIVSYLKEYLILVTVVFFILSLFFIKG